MSHMKHSLPEHSATFETFFVLKASEPEKNALSFRVLNNSVVVAVEYNQVLEIQAHFRLPLPLMHHFSYDVCCCLVCVVRIVLGVGP